MKQDRKSIDSLISGPRFRHVGVFHLRVCWMFRLYGIQSPDLQVNSKGILIKYPVKLLIKKSIALFR